MKGIDLSVIVACYNIGDYIDECLQSIVQTRFPHDRMEVLAIDDGSTDGKTPQIIDRYAKQYNFVRAIHSENNGVSAVRNYGIDHAKGKYIAFVDGDDTVPDTAYPELMYTAETYHSNVVAGFVHRFDNLRHVRSYLHKFAIKDTKFHTTIKQTPNLLYDSTCWNKVYKKSFLDKNHIRFVKGILYEDLPFVLKAHLLSNNDSLIKDNVYNWRWRTNSITQSRSALNNYVGRLASLDRCRDELLKAGFNKNSRLFQDFVKKMLIIDLPIYLQDCGDTLEPYIYDIQEITYKFLRNWHLLNANIMQTLPLKFQIIYYAIKSGNSNLLQKYTYTHNIGDFYNYHLTKKPEYRIPELNSDILSHLNTKMNTLRISQKLAHLNVDPETHMVTGDGMFKIKHLHMVKKMFSDNNYHETLGANLENIDTSEYIPIHFVRNKTPTYKRVLHPKSSWTNSRYVFQFNYIKALNKLGKGNWMIKVGDQVGDYNVISYLGAPTKQSHNKITPVTYNSLVLYNDFLNDWKLVFRAKSEEVVGSKNVNWIGTARTEGNILCFDADLINSNVVPELVLDQNHVFTGRIMSLRGKKNVEFDLRRLPMTKPYSLDRLILIDVKTGNEIPYLFKKSLDDRFFSVNMNRLVVKYKTKTCICVALVHHPLVVHDYNVDQNDVLTMHMTSLYRLTQYEQRNMTLCLMSLHLKSRYVINPSEISANNYSLTLHIPLLANHNKQLRILNGRYHLVCYLPLSGRVRMLSVTMDTENAMENFQPLKLKSRQDSVGYKVATNTENNFIFKIHQHKVGFDKKKNHRAIAYSILYPLMRLLPIKKHTVIFDSYWASQFSSNERAIYEYMQKHYPHYNYVWFLKNDQLPISGNGKRVRPKSLKYWYYLATAKYIFQNTNMPDQYLKRNKQIETETLHGTFLKHMGFDEPGFKNGSRNKQDRFARRIRRWDYMIVPSQYMGHTASRAFDYHQKLINAGFPRNDELVKNNNMEYIDSIKRKLGIPLNKTVILYAPTYRKGDHRFMINLDHLQKTLPKNDALLVRLHYFVAHSHSFYNYPGFVYDVSDYPDINDLFLISDAMITDYSSVMFDYAYLKRPMIFYAYDRDMYLSSKYRGVYLNYETDMPGPIVTDQKQLETCLLHLSDIKTQYKNKINQFSAKFAQYGDDGKATQQVVKTVLGTKNKQLNQEPDRDVIFNKCWHLFKINNLQSMLINYFGQVLPKKNIIIFDSFFGTQYSDNPKALYLYIKKHYPKYKLYWNVNKENIGFFKKHHIPYIKRFSYRGLIKQAEAKYWIVNARRPFRWQPARGTKILMTWHGTPLKTIGADVAKVTMPDNNAKKYHRQVYKDNRRWNYLLTPNTYTTNIMYRAFRKNANQLLLDGYPRNDILINHNDTKTINKIKDRLGIDHKKKVVLYAPTWRDNEFVKSDEFIAHLHLNLDEIRKHFHNNVIILVRVHYMISNHLDLSKYKDIAMNVSDYPDIADLYLISDVLITDYSSVMFDYSILKRPMIFFDYDFKNYAETTRGFYFDFRKVAPGPIVTTTDGVIQQLDKIFNGHWKLNSNYRKFIDKFDQWMDGHASKRVAKELLGGSNVNETALSLKQLHLPNTVEVKDGSLSWDYNKDFTDQYSVSFAGYINGLTKCQALYGMQLQSNSFKELIGMRYLLVRYHGHKVWVNINDIDVPSIEK